MLPLGGLMMALFVGYVMNKEIVKDELNANQSIIDTWFMIIKVFSPILLIIIYVGAIAMLFLFVVMMLDIFTVSKNNVIYTFLYFCVFFIITFFIITKDFKLY